ncbi:MAG: phosphodiesterase [Clostridia bacterium]|nr:phosphodiesterase [Clostridia bacterium]
MPIVIISDTHGSLEGWEKANHYLNGADLILHAGDILYHGPRNPIPPGYDPAALAQAINDVGVPTIVARGNCDADVDQLVIRTPIQSPYAWVSIDGVRILVTHGDREVVNRDELVAGGQIHLWVSGHTHIPKLEIKGPVMFVNPGSLGLPKAGEPSLAILEGKRISIVGVETGKILMADSLS